jgi:UDP-glucose 4-epimerase
MVVITGHQGFIGSYLTQKIKYYGVDKKSGNNILYCELPMATTVIHLAAEPGVVASVKDPYMNAFTNIMGTIRLCKKYSNARFIFASSGGTIQEKIISPYGLSKYTCEEYIKLLCDDYVILRFPNVYGDGSRSVIDKFLNSEESVIYGDGSATRTYGYIDDVVEAIVQAQKWPCGTYKLGGVQNYSVLEIAEAIGHPIRFEPKRKGELDHSFLPRETHVDIPETMDVMEYIKLCKNENN